MRTGRLCLLAIALGLASASHGAMALTVEDETLACELLGLEAGPTAVLRVGGKVRRVPCADLLAIDLRDERPTPRPGHHRGREQPRRRAAEPAVRRRGVPAGSHRASRVPRRPARPPAEAR